MRQHPSIVRHTLNVALLLCVVLQCTWAKLGIPGWAMPWQPKSGTKPVAYQGSAFLMGYYAGVTQALLEKRVLVPGVTPTSGLSGGAYTLTLTQLGFNGTNILDFWKAIIDEGNRRLVPGGMLGRLNVLSVWALEDVFRAASLRDIANVFANMRIAVSQLDASKLALNNSASWVVDKWDGVDDLISNLLGTSYIPCFSGPTTYNIFRNQPVVDGAFGNGFKELCPNGNTKNCIKVGSWVVGALADHTCNARCGPQLKDNCSAPERTSTTSVLYKNGKYVDRWNLAEIQLRCPEVQWQDKAPFPLPYYVPQNSTMPDIYPGKYNPLPEWPPHSGNVLLACEWQNFAMAPPLGQFDEFIAMTYKLGYQDALAWCKLHA